MDEMKAQITAKEASLALRETQILESYERLTQLRLIAWMVLLVGIVLCFAGLGLIYWSRHSRVIKINNSSE